MGIFHEAHAAIDHAIAVLPAGDRVLASALGTRGLIYLEEGKDQDAAQWLRTAIDEFRRQTSPSLTSMADDLGRVTTTLKRLGRSEEAEVVQHELDAVHARLRAIPQSEADRSVDAAIPGAVLIELTGVSSLRGTDRYEEITGMVGKARRLIRLRDVGFYRGKVSISESTALIFHSSSPEVLWSAIEPCVMAERVAAGARITIRDGATHREVFVPMPMAALN